MNTIHPSIYPSACLFNHHPFVQPFNYPLVNQILTYYYVLGGDVGTRDIQNGTI